MAKQVVNNGDSGLVSRTKINDNFTELYTTPPGVPDASSTVKGIAKLYPSTGSNTDGAMDQNSATNAFQGKDATLTALAGLATGASKVPYSTGTDTFGQLDLDTDGTLAANSDTSLATQKAIKDYVDASNVGSTLFLFYNAQ